MAENNSDRKPRTYVAARVEDEILDAMKALAKADRRSLSFMIEEALREFVKSRKADDKRKR